MARTAKNEGASGYKLNRSTEEVLTMIPLATVNEMMRDFHTAETEGAGCPALSSRYLNGGYFFIRLLP